MRLIVKQDFCDKFTNQMYRVGQTIDIEDPERVADLTKRNLAEASKKPKKKK